MHLFINAHCFDLFQAQPIEYSQVVKVLSIVGSAMSIAALLMALVTLAVLWLVMNYC